MAPGTLTTHTRVRSVNATHCTDAALGYANHLTTTWAVPKTWTNLITDNLFLYIRCLLGFNLPLPAITLPLLVFNDVA